MDYFDREEFGSLELWFYQCAPLRSAGRETARLLIGLLQEAGGEFLRLRPGQHDGPIWEVHPHPEELISPEGNLATVDFGHLALDRTLLEPVAMRSLPPSGSLSFDHDSGTLVFSQSGSQDEAENLDALARGLWNLGVALYPILRPQYGFIDENGTALDETKVLRQPMRDNLAHNTVPYIFWANFLSPAVTNHHGRELFLKAPCWKKEVFADGGILLGATASYLQWWAKPPAPVEKYFAQQISRHVYNTDWLFAGGPEEIPFEL